MQDGKSKLQEQATGKKDLSYSYWAANQTEGASIPEPKKLSEEEAQKMKQQEEVQQGSKWNTAQTFEERDYSTKVRDRLQDICKELAQAEGDARLAVQSATATGEAHVWIVRGRRRYGFEYQLDVTLTAHFPSQETPLEGTARVYEATIDELENLAATSNFESMSKLPKDEQNCLGRLARALEKQLVEVVKQVVEELKSY